MNRNESRHNYGIDLLRIIAMLMIVAHHFSLHSGISPENNSIHNILMQVLALGGKTGVNIFVLITGFYSSGRIRYRKILNLVGCSTVYSIVLTIGAILVGSVGISKKMLLKAAVPLLFGNAYWFITTYLELYILIPILNMVSEKLNKITYRNYLVLFTLLLSLLPKVVGGFIYVNDLGYNALVWFVYLYFLGAYLKKFAISSTIAGCTAIGCVFIHIAACVILCLDIAAGGLARLLACAADYSANAVFPLVISVSMLLWFRNLNINRGRKFTSLLGSATLGVYLFHDNVNFRGWLWSVVYRLITGIGLDSFAANAALSIILVFALGSAIEICRMTITQKLRKILEGRRNPDLKK